MTNQPAWVPRLSIAIPEEEYLALQRDIPWGMKTHLFLIFIRELLAIVKEHGPISLALLTRHGFTIHLKEPQHEDNSNRQL
jgi:hypothetical protein